MLVKHYVHCPILQRNSIVAGESPARTSASGRKQPPPRGRFRVWNQRVDATP